MILKFQLNFVFFVCGGNWLRKSARVGNSDQGRGANSDYLMPLSQARRNGDFARKKVARCPL
jgi:hypothetical protein